MSYSIQGHLGGVNAMYLSLKVDPDDPVTKLCNGYRTRYPFQTVKELGGKQTEHNGICIIWAHTYSFRAFLHLHGSLGWKRDACFDTRIAP